MDDHAREQAVIEALQQLGVTYDLVRIDPAFTATADFCAEYGYAMEDSGNCIVVVGKTGEPAACACVVQAVRRLDVNKVVRRLLGVRRASFANAEQTEEITGMLTGGITPFGMPAELPIYADPMLLERPHVIVGGGSRSLKIVVPPAALLAIPGAQAIDGLTIPGA